MIGNGGNRIGRPPAGVPDSAPKDVGGVPAKAASVATPAGPAGQTSAKAPDKFEKAGRGPHERVAVGATGLGRESAGADVLKLTRESPAAAIRICEGLLAQSRATLGDIERELAGARAVLDALVRERFSKEALAKSGQALREKRDKVAALKRLQQACARRMSLLQQVAGHLASPALEREIDDFWKQHGRLRSGWGRLYHVLSLGEALFSADVDAPEHLRDVVQTSIRASTHGAEVAEILGDLSPQRIIAELLARTLDGSTSDVTHHHPQVARGDLGRAMQSYALAMQLFLQSAATDPFAKR